MVQKVIHELVENKNLDFEAIKEVMDEVMSGNATQAQISSFLTALRMKGETTDEITARATVMRDEVVELSPFFPVVDIAGTGGDEVGTFNISTTSALVAVAGGIRVAKHGNRSVSSKSSAADVPERLGAELALTTRQVETVLEGTGMCLLFVPVYHSSIKYTAPAREGIGIRSILNILSPLSNPAGASMQLLGVYSRDPVGPLAQILANLGVTRRMVACGGDGLDEATFTGPTHVCKIRYGKITAYDMTPEELGLVVCSLEKLIGDVPEGNVKITRNILPGSLKGPKRDVVIPDAATSLYLGIDGCTVRDCTKTVQDVTDSGAAMTKVEEFIQATKKAIGEMEVS